MARDWALLALSLANLVFLRSWADLLRLQAAGESSAAQARTLLVATVASVALLAGLLLCGRWLLERSANPVALTAARCGLLFLFVTPLDFLDGQVRPLTDGWMPQPLYLALWTALLLVPVLAAVTLAVYRNASLYRALRTLLLVLSPLALLLPANLAWSAHRSAPPASQVELAGPVGQGKAARLVWIVFDEFDYHLAFEARPSSIEMPELDRFRREAFFARHALTSAWETPEAMLGYLTGQPVSKFDAKPPLFRVVTAGGASLDLKGQPTILSEARKLGLDTYVAGWYLPYCQIFGAQLTGCLQPSAATVRAGSFSKSFAEQWSGQYREHWLVTRFSAEGRLRAPWFGWAERTDQFHGYQQLLAESLRVSAGDGGRLVLLHFPIPHPLGIYDRKTNELSLNTANNSIDNLELVDRTVGEIRRAMEESSHWKNAAVIVTSDHPMRPDVWAKSEVWSEEERKATGNRRRNRVPCLIKPPGGGSGLDSDREFPVGALSSLALAMLAGEVRTVEDVARYLAAGTRYAFPTKL